MDWPAVTDALAGRDFQVLRDAKRIAYAGSVQIADKRFAVEVEFQDQEFTRPPRVRLAQKYPELPFGTPHIEIDGGICFAAPHILTLDRAFPAWSVERCLNLAEQALEAALAGTSANEPIDEFLAYWGGSDLLVDLPDNLEADSGCLATLRLAVGPRLILGETFNALSKRFGQLLVRKSAQSVYVTRLTSSKVANSQSIHWPPKTVHDVMRWVDCVQPDLSTRLPRAVEKAFESGKDQMVVSVTTPRNRYAFRVKLAKREAFHAAQTYRRAILSRSIVGQMAQIDRLAPKLVSMEHLVSRNLSDGHGSLMGKKVVIVGAGALGSHLCSSLVRVGAGTNATLTIIDNDELSPGNLGRHVLGFSDLGMNKAKAVAARLVGDHPGVSIHPESSTAEQCERALREAHIVIDTTGSEPLSQWLSEKRRAGLLPPVLYCWIEGNGARSVAYLQDSPSAACYRCFRAPDPLSQSQFLPPDYDLETSTAGACDSIFVPFSISAVLQCTSIATKLAVDWASGSPSPRLRVVHCDVPDAYMYLTSDPPRSANCPACG